ncbi:MAG: GNAT family N-acetyltransferase [Candidatus Nanoarchaeia archaeon]
MREELVGNEILLRKLKLKDTDDIYSCVNDKEVIKWLVSLPWPYKREHAKEFIKKSFSQKKKKTAFDFAICFPDDNRVIGCISLNKIDNVNRKAEIGYWLSRKHWGKGIMSEALWLIERFAFKDLKLNRIYAYVLEENRSSAGVLEKRSFKNEGKLRKNQKIRGKYYNTIIYSKLRR